MPDPWISPAAVLKRICNLLRKDDPSDLPASFLEDAQQAAYTACEEIRTIFRRHGWKAADIELWDGRIFYGTQLATYHAAILCIGLADYNMEAINALDCRKWLDEFAELSVAGEPVAPPADATIGGATFGSVTASDTRRCSGFDPLGLFR